MHKTEETVETMHPITPPTEAVEYRVGAKGRSEYYRSVKPGVSVIVMTKSRPSFLKKPGPFELTIQNLEFRPYS